MEATYELWAVDAGNIVGSFATRDEALNVVRALLDAYGRGYAQDLNLSHRDGDGPSRVVAMGEQLLELVDRRTREHAAAPSD
jgi:hypothetical protein